MKEEDLNCVCIHTPTLNIEVAGPAMALIIFDARHCNEGDITGLVDGEVPVGNLLESTAELVLAK
jgi:hypothetical protein